MQRSIYAIQIKIFKKCNNFAGKIFQLKSKSHYVNCSARNTTQTPFIIRLQFRQVKWFLRKVRLVVFSQIFVGRVSRPRAQATFAPGGKSSQKRHLDLRSKNPLARGETFLAGNFPTRPRRFSRFSRSEGLCQHSFPRGAVARRCPVATVGVLRSIVFGDYQTAPKPPGGRLWEVRPRARGYICECFVKIPLRNRQFS